MQSFLAQWHDTIGVAGMVLYLASYFLLHVGVIRSNSVTYCVANIFAASMVMISLLHDFNLASALIQIAWIAISAIGLIRMAIAPQHAKSGNALLH